MVTSAQRELEVVSQIVKALKDGTAPWRKSWSASGGLALRENGVPYQGMNQVILGMLNDKPNPMWLTYNKAAELSGQRKEKGRWVTGEGKGVRPGPGTGEWISFMGSGKSKKEGEEGKPFKFLKWYCVFNCSDIEGLPDRYYPQPVERESSNEVIPHVDAYLDNLGADVRHGGDRAFYAPGPDFIQLPNPQDFDNIVSYYGTALHEQAHRTGHKSRLDRSLDKGSFGDKVYALEELCAEMSAAFACSHLGIENTVREDHSSYIASWIKKLQDDPKALRKACTAASKVIAWMDDQQPQEQKIAA